MIQPLSGQVRAPIIDEKGYITPEWERWFRQLVQAPMLISLPIYANNAAAVAGKLKAGELYRTGGDPDLVCVVH